MVGTSDIDGRAAPMPRVPVHLGWLAFCAVLGAGCAAPPEPVDTSLPLKERVAILTGQIEERDQALVAAKREIAELKSQISRQKQLTPSANDLEFMTQRIDIGWLSGGRNWDGKPGDDGVRLFVFPIDQDGHTVKRVGAVGIRLTDEAMPEGQRRVGDWKFSPAEAARKWTSTAVAYGYQFDLRWQTGLPAHADLTAYVEFTGLDGRRFRATRKLPAVKLPPVPTTRPETPAQSP